MPTPGLPNEVIPYPYLARSLPTSVAIDRSDSLGTLTFCGTFLVSIGTCQRIDKSFSNEFAFVLHCFIYCAIRTVVSHPLQDSIHNRRVKSWRGVELLHNTYDNILNRNELILIRIALMCSSSSFYRTWLKSSPQSELSFPNLVEHVIVSSDSRITLCILMVYRGSLPSNLLQAFDNLT